MSKLDDLSDEDTFLFKECFVSTAKSSAPVKSQKFRELTTAMDGLFTKSLGDYASESISFPPVMSRHDAEVGGYCSNFPHLLGDIWGVPNDQSRETMRSSNRGKALKADLGRRPTEWVLTPAACYQLYPILGVRSPLPDSGSCFEVSACCFRNENSQELGRLKSFEMRELVFVGGESSINEFLSSMINLTSVMMNQLQLDYELDEAHDPFFGRLGKFQAKDQVERSLKIELNIRVSDKYPQTACASFNNHEHHFSRAWQIKLENGALANTCCVAIGLERLSLAVFKKHGLNIGAWPPEVRSLLWNEN